MIELRRCRCCYCCDWSMSTERLRRRYLFNKDIGTQESGDMYTWRGSRLVQKGRSVDKVYKVPPSLARLILLAFRPFDWLHHHHHHQMDDDDGP